MLPLTLSATVTYSDPYKNNKHPVLIAPILIAMVATLRFRSLDSATSFTGLTLGQQVS